MRSLLITVFALCLGGLVGTAQATPISGSFQINVWQGYGNGSKTGDAEQALPTNPLKTDANLLGTYSYSGAIDFASGTNNIFNFLSSAGGTLGGGNLSALNTKLSTSGFQLTTLMQITGTTGNAIMGSIGHDDGISLWQNGSNVVPTSASAPTSLDFTPYSLNAGDFNLWYVEANGLPANLTMDVAAVPEPSSLALMALSLLALGFAMRRKMA